MTNQSRASFKPSPECALVLKIDQFLSLISSSFKISEISSGYIILSRSHLLANINIGLSSNSSSCKSALNSSVAIFNLSRSEESITNITPEVPG